MPYIAPYRSQLRPYNHAYAYRGLTAFATLSMAVSDSRFNEMSKRFFFLYTIPITGFRSQIQQKYKSGSGIKSSDRSQVINDHTFVVDVLSETPFQV
ncbi:MAG: hypothetical protein ABW170_12005 [Candidatus Thiodiazotropha sp. L084R]